MIQCEQCEFFRRNEKGEIALQCDPFRNIKEPECLAKWQLIRTTQMVSGYQATLDYYRRLAPMQEKMFKVMEREIDEMNEAEKWKAPEEDEEDFEPGDDWPSSPDDPLYP